MRTAEASDVPAMMELERQCPEAAHWTQEQYESATDRQALPERFVWVADAGMADTKILGFLVAQRIAEDWELENMAVSQEVRRRGVGGLLLKNLVEKASAEQGRRILLEVRESNRVARALYERFNFVPIGVRQGYYMSPVEDAVLYCRILP